ncbi:hypothetical protein OROMI_009073 [Orobanche minor]
MANTACFMIVSKNDIPIYEGEVGTVPKKEDAAHQHQFILHAALDIVQDMAWTTGAMFLKAIDRFNDLVVSVYVTAELSIKFVDFRQDVSSWQWRIYMLADIGSITAAIQWTRTALIDLMKDSNLY